MPRGLAGRLRVHRVIAACDCGQIIHPGIVEQQITGSIVGGLSAMFHERITLENGAVKQANFNDYPLLRIDEAPADEVHSVPSTVARGLSPIICSVTDAGSWFGTRLPADVHSLELGSPATEAGRTVVLLNQPSCIVA